MFLFGYKRVLNFLLNFNYIFIFSQRTSKHLLSASFGRFRKARRHPHPSITGWFCNIFERRRQVSIHLGNCLHLSGFVSGKLGFELVTIIPDRPLQMGLVKEGLIETFWQANVILPSKVNEPSWIKFCRAPLWGEEEFQNFHNQKMHVHLIFF